MSYSFRKPTFEEFEERVNNLRFGIAVVIYCSIAFGGQHLFYKFVHDAAYEEIFMSVWWLPAGLITWFATFYSTQWLIDYVPEEE